MRISDWRSDVCSSDLQVAEGNEISGGTDARCGVCRRNVDWPFDAGMTTGLAMKPMRGYRRKDGQGGATAIEFAFVFQLLLFLVYAIFVSTYLFVLRESIAFAAHTGIEAAVAVDPGSAAVPRERRIGKERENRCSS